MILVIGSIASATFRPVHQSELDLELNIETSGSLVEMHAEKTVYTLDAKASSLSATTDKSSQHASVQGLDPNLEKKQLITLPAHLHDITVNKMIPKSTIIAMACLWFVASLLKGAGYSIPFVFLVSQTYDFNQLKSWFVHF